MKMNEIRQAILCMIVAMLIAGPGGATVIRYQNFNTDTTGFILSDNNGTADRTGDESAVSGVFAGASARMAGDGDSDPVPAGPNMYSWMGVGDDTNLQYKIEFDYRQELSQGNLFQVWDTTSTKGANIYVSHWQNRNIQIQENGSWTDTGVGMTLGEWYHWELTLVAQNNSGNDTFELVVTDSDGNILLSGTYDFNADIDSYSRVFWSNGLTSPSAIFDVDNVVMKTLSPMLSAMNLPYSDDFEDALTNQWSLSNTSEGSIDTTGEESPFDDAAGLQSVLLTDSVTNTTQLMSLVSKDNLGLTGGETIRFDYNAQLAGASTLMLQGPSNAGIRRSGLRLYLNTQGNVLLNQTANLINSDFTDGLSGFSTNAGAGSITVDADESDFSSKSNSVNLFVWDGLSPRPYMTTTLPDSNTNANVQITFDLRVSAGQSMLFQVRDGADTKGVNMYTRYWDATRTVRIRENGSWTDTGVTLDVDGWYNFNLLLDPADTAGLNTFELTVTDTNGVEVISGTYSFDSDIAAYDDIIWTSAGNSDYNIDNVRFSESYVIAENMSTSDWYRAEITLGDLSGSDDRYSIDLYHETNSTTPIVTAENIPFYEDLDYVERIKFENTAYYIPGLLSVDNVLVIGELVGYSVWISGYSVGELNGMTDDADGDGLVNLVEFALGGDPSSPDSGDNGHVPEFSIVPDGGTNWLTYVYAKRTAADSLGLNYHVERATDLVAGDWTNVNVEVVGAGTLIPGEFDSVTNRVQIDTEPQQFLKLVIESN